MPGNFAVSAQLTDSPYFVIEADEYDCAFFDKRSKFLHYHPQIAILNNLEFDHADIFDDIHDIQRQFHFLMRTIPDNGVMVRPDQDVNLDKAQGMGCWTPQVTFGSPQADWSFALIEPDASCFDVVYRGEKQGQVQWSIWGLHNANNALAAIAAATAVDVVPSAAIKALATFRTSTRRMELKGVVRDIKVYDDFAHHPTAIATTLGGFRARLGQKPRIIAVLELRSYTMRSGYHQDTLAASWKDADSVHILRPDAENWDADQLLQLAVVPTALYNNMDSLLQGIIDEAQVGDNIVVMSIGGFEAIHGKLLEKLG